MLSRSVRSTSTALRGVRQMSSHGSPEQVFSEKEMWLKTTAFMAGALILPYTAFVIYKEATHAHSHEHATYPHMKVRRKAFPWAASDCDFFDLPCHRAFASGAAAAPHH